MMMMIMILYKGYLDVTLQTDSNRFIAHSFLCTIQIAHTLPQFGFSQQYTLYLLEFEIRFIPYTWSLNISGHLNNTYEAPTRTATNRIVLNHRPCGAKPWPVILCVDKRENRP